MSKDYSTEIQINGSKNGGLTASDYDNFSRSFITPEIVEAAGIYRVNDEQGAEILCRKRQAGKDYSGLVFPYRNELTGEVLEYEIRRDNPEKEVINGREKIKGKYLRPNKSKSFLYFVPKTNPEHLQDAFTLWILTEGVKKALSIIAALTNNLKKPSPFLVSAISGVDNFRTSQKQRNDFGGLDAVSDVLPQIKNINLVGREVLIVFDPNVLTNASVYFARHRLAETLLSLGAVVYFLNLPILTNERGESLDGIDDILGFWNEQHGREKAVEMFNNLFRQKRKFVKSAVFSRPLCNGNLTLKIGHGERNKLKVSALDAANQTIDSDLFNPSDRAKRSAFLAKAVFPAFDASDNDQKEITSELVRLADLAEIVTVYDKKQSEETEAETIETSFKVLSDGRIIEQIRGGFGLYNSESGEFEIVQSVADSDGTIYAPVKDALFETEGGLYLANDLTEYGTTEELHDEIKNYLTRFLDLQPLQLALTATYILFTYLFDKTKELSYLNPTGAGGSGKSRYGLTVTVASRRGLLLSDPSASSIFRTVDRCKPTLFIDEFNNNEQSDDAAAIIKILNTGFQDLTKIPRSVKNADGGFDTELFDPYCPKLIGSLKQSASNAFNTRCIEIQMQPTTRNDIPIRLSNDLINRAQVLRNKLTLFRLRNYHNDFEKELDRAEMELRNSGIIPRSIQVNIPLYALITDDETKKDFINLLKGRDETLSEEKNLSLDGDVIDKIHTLLFEVFTEENGEMTVELNRKEFSAIPADGEICEKLRVEKLLSMINANRPKEIAAQYFGKVLLGLGLHTKKITRRSSEHRLKKAVIFDRNTLINLFKNFKLPFPDNFNVTNVTKNDKPINNNGLTVVTLTEKSADGASQCYQSNLSNSATYGTGNIGNIKNPETNGNKKKYVQTEI